jgi:putative ubiquitin-RnfH superfamily antitoxin RatB of RatAB toxin-antitoxin module
MATVEAASTIVVQVAYSPRAGVVDEAALTLPAGSTVAVALRVSGLFERHPGAAVLAGAPGNVGVWGRLRPPEHVLRDGDRIELYRPLQVDPKEARRLRQRAASR